MNGCSTHGMRVNRTTVHGKILVGENLANHDPFAKIFLANIHRYTESIYGICALTIAYSPNFSSPIALPAWFSKIFPRQIFPMYSIQHFCGFSINYVCEEAVYHVTYLFLYGYHDSWQKCAQWLCPFSIYNMYASRGIVNACFNPQWHLFYVCLVV